MPKLPLTKGQKTGTLFPSPLVSICKGLSPKDSTSQPQDEALLVGSPSSDPFMGRSSVAVSRVPAVHEMMGDGWVAGEDVRPLSARADLTPPLTARQAQSSRLKGLHDKVEKLLQVYAVPCTPGSVARPRAVRDVPTPQYTGTASATRLPAEGGCGDIHDRFVYPELQHILGCKSKLCT